MSLTPEQENPVDMIRMNALGLAHEFGLQHGEPTDKVLERAADYEDFLTGQWRTSRDLNARVNRIVDATLRQSGRGEASGQPAQEERQQPQGLSGGQDERPL